MQYYARVNRKLKNTRVYTITKRIGGQNVGLMSRIFIKLFSVFAQKEDNSGTEDSAGRMG